MGSEDKPLILNIQFKELCEYLRNGYSEYFPIYKERFTMVPGQLSCAAWIIENCKMKRIYKPYTEWEDYINGMYSTPKKETELELINKAKELLKNELMFFNVAFEMVKIWNISTEVNLSNINHNRQAWIGQASACYQFGVPEVLTRISWSELSETERYKANEVADKIIRWYERKDNELHSGLGAQMLF